jgi:hypothetical protein
LVWLKIFTIDSPSDLLSGDFRAMSLVGSINVNIYIPVKFEVLTAVNIIVRSSRMRWQCRFVDRY